MNLNNFRSTLETFSLDSFAVAVFGLVDELKKARTKPIEVGIGLLMLGQGILYSLPTNLFTNFQLFAIMSRLTSHGLVASWNISTGVLLLSALIRQRMNTNRRVVPASDLPRSVIYELDTYFEVNATCLMFRRAALLSAVCWNFYAFAMFLATVPYGPGWVYAFCFFVQSVWVIIRLRVDELRASAEIMRCKIEASRNETYKEIGEMVRGIVGDTDAKDYKADALDKTHRVSPMGGCLDDSSGKAGRRCTGV